MFEPKVANIMLYIVEICEKGIKYNLLGCLTNLFKKTTMDCPNDRRVDFILFLMMLMTYNCGI